MRGLKKDEMDANESRFLTVLVGFPVLAGRGGGWRADVMSAAVWLVGKGAATCGIVPISSADTVLSTSSSAEGEEDEDEDSDSERG